MKKVAGKIRLQLAQFRELEAFMQFSQDLDETTKKRIDEGERLSEALKQGKNVPLPFEHQVVMIYAAINGLLEKVPVVKIKEFEEKLIHFVDSNHPDIFKTILTGKDITEDLDKELKEVLEKFMKTHPELETA